MSVALRAPSRDEAQAYYATTRVGETKASVSPYFFATGVFYSLPAGSAPSPPATLQSTPRTQRVSRCALYRQASTAKQRVKLYRERTPATIALHQCGRVAHPADPTAGKNLRNQAWNTLFVVFVDGTKLSCERYASSPPGSAEAQTAQRWRSNKDRSRHRHQQRDGKR